MQTYLFQNLSELAHRRAILLREEAQLWDILSRDLTREARRSDQAETRLPPKLTPPAPSPQAPHMAGVKLLVGVAEAARMMGIGRSSLYNEIAASRIRTRKAGRRTLIAVADIEAWCDALTPR